MQDENTNFVQRKTLLILSFSEIMSDSRLLKQISYFSQFYDLTVLGLGSKPDLKGGFHYINLNEHINNRSLVSKFVRILRALFFLLRLYTLSVMLNPQNRAVSKVSGGKVWDVVIVNDTSGLAAVNFLNSNCGFLADLHEYAPRQNENSWWKHIVFGNYQNWICKTLLPRANKVTTVSLGLAKEYKKQYGVEVEVVTNATPHHPELSPTIVTEPIKLVHAGVYEQGRGIELIIVGIKNSSANVTLDLYLTGLNDNKLRELNEVIGGDSRVTIHNPVPYESLIKTLNSYDLGVFVLPPNQFSFKHALPNKIFDFIQARLGIIIGPSIEMIPYVEKYHLGRISSDFSSEAFKDVTENISIEDVQRWKISADLHAEELSANTQVEIWGRLIREILD